MKRLLNSGRLADTTKYVLLGVAANNSLRSVVHVHEKKSRVLNMRKYKYFRSPLIVVLNTVKNMMVVLVRRFTTFASIRHPWGQLSDQVGLTAPRNYATICKAP